MAWVCTDTGNGFNSMLGGRKITAGLTGETVEWSVANCILQKGILLPIAVYALL